MNSFNNSWYNPGSKIKILLWIIVSSFFFRHSLAIYSPLKCFLLRLFGAKVGRQVMIKPCVTIKYPWFLTIDDFAWIGENVWIDNLAQVNIGKNACISQGAMLLTGNHNYKKTTFDLIIKPIEIKESVWIGARTTVCPGVTCYENSILTVGSILSSDMEMNGIYKGHPASFIKYRTAE